MSWEPKSKRIAVENKKFFKRRKVSLAAKGFEMLQKKLPEKGGIEGCAYSNYPMRVTPSLDILGLGGPQIIF